MIAEETFTKQWLIKANNNLGWKRGDNQLKNIEKAVVIFILIRKHFSIYATHLH